MDHPHERLLTQRRRLALTQTQLAERITEIRGVGYRPLSYTSVLRWEHGHCLPRGATLAALEQVLGISLSDDKEVADGADS